MPTIINAADLDSPVDRDYITAAQAAGHIAAGQYIKHLTTASIALCAAMKFRIWIIDEGWGNKAVFSRGYQGGLEDGKNAALRMKGFNIPPGTVVFFAIDYGADESDIANVLQYEKGYAIGCAPYIDGMYADGLIASAVPTRVGDYVPGASGWPGTRDYLTSGKVAIIQHPPATMFGTDVDPCQVVDESVLWSPWLVGNQAPVAVNTQTSPAPSPAQAPVQETAPPAVPVPENPSPTPATPAEPPASIPTALGKPPMRDLIQLGDSGDDVLWIQKKLNVPWLPQSGVFDQAMAYVVQGYQATNNLEPDGLVGKLTQAELG